MTLEVTNWFTQLIKKRYAANLSSRPHLKFNDPVSTRFSFYWTY